MRNPNVELLLFLKNRLALRAHNKDELLNIWIDRSDSEISYRTIDRNVEFLRNLGYDIESGYEDRKRTYRLIDEYEHDILEKIENHLRISEMPELANPNNVVAPPSQKGIELLPLLLENINKRRTISFDYHAYDKNPKPKTIYPIILKVYQDIWHVHGYCLKEKDYRTYGVDRIQDLKKLGKYDWNRLPNVEEKIDLFKMYLGSSRPLDNYFKDGIKKPEVIKLRVSDFYLDYLTTKPIHPSQKIIKEDTVQLKKLLTGELLSYTLVTYYLIPNLDLIKFIVSQLGDIVVENPKNLKEYIRIKLNDLENHLIN